MRIINPSLPDPYKYEKDYRNIPKQYLDNDIPRGRGMIKWAPFATMPQQYETINQFINDQTKVNKPILSSDALDDLNYVLAEKIFYHPDATIKYWENGYYKMMHCEIHTFDSEHNILQVKKEHELIKIKLNCIVEIM